MNLQQSLSSLKEELSKADQTLRYVLFAEESLRIIFSFSLRTYRFLEIVKKHSNNHANQ